MGVAVTVAVLVGVAVSCLITAGVDVGNGVFVGSTVVKLQASGSKKARPSRSFCHKERWDMIRSALQMSDRMISVLQIKLLIAIRRRAEKSSAFWPMRLCENSNIVDKRAKWIAVTAGFCAACTNFKSLFLALKNG